MRRSEMKRETKYPYIMVDSEGVVQNIAMFDDYASANTLTKACYGDGACAYAYRYAVSIGDRCVDGTFYVEDEKGVLTEAEYIPSDEDQISALNDQLMDAYLAFARIDAVRGLLEVRHGNGAAKHLYEKNGYHLLACRKNYYKHPDEDADIYEIAFTENGE